MKRDSTQNERGSEFDVLTVFNSAVWITSSVLFISGLVSVRLGIRIYDEVELMVEKLQA